MRRLELAANLLFVLGPYAIGMLILIFLMPSLTMLASLTSFGIGLSLLVCAKYDLFKRGIWFSFGSSRRNTASRNAYHQAYVLIAVGVALNLIALLTLHTSG